MCVHKGRGGLRGSPWVWGGNSYLGGEYKLGEGCHINYSLYLSRAPLSITLKHLRIPDYAEGGERRPHYNASLENQTHCENLRKSWSRKIITPSWHVLLEPNVSISERILTRLSFVTSWSFFGDTSAGKRRQRAARVFNCRKHLSTLDDTAKCSSSAWIHILNIIRSHWNYVKISTYYI